MKKQYWLALLLVILAAIYIVPYIRDWNKAKIIHISWREMPKRGNTPSQVWFQLEVPCLLNSVKVVAVEDAATNKYPHALWHLIAKKKVQPLTELYYSRALLGMSPAIPKTRPEPLVPGVKYRLLVDDAKNAHGQVDFSVRP
jgi:hypothetical protein